MTFQAWLMYLVLVIVATSTPGPAILFAMTNATLYGWKKAIFAALGNISGVFCIGLIAVTGLGTMLRSSVVLFSCVKYVGAAYLIYLGLKMIFKKGIRFDSLQNQMIIKDVSSKKVFFQALCVALSNPKAIIFLTALFPQFINVNDPLIPQFSALVSILMSFSFLFLMAYALLAEKAKGWLSKPGRVKVMNCTSGSFFVGFGLLLATASNKS